MIADSVLDAMLASGCSAEQIVAAVKASRVTERDMRDERDRLKREAAKLRQRRHREASVVTRDKRDTKPSPRARVEDKTLLLGIEPQEVRKKENKGATATPRFELEAVLDADHAGWVLDHRQRLRKPLSVRGAHQLAVKLGQCPDPNAAADLMIEKGWQSIEVGWLDQQPRGSPRQRTLEPTAGDIFAEMTRRFDDGPDDRTETRDQQFDGDHHRYLPRSQ